jgi:hypothetical protein
MSFKRTALLTGPRVHFATPFLPRAEPSTHRRRVGIIYMFLTHVHGVSVIGFHRLDLAQLLLCPFGCSRCRLPGMPPRTVCRASSEISPETLCPSEHAPRISHSGWSERHTDIHFPAHRTLIVRKLKGLEEFISFSNVHYLMSMTTGRSTAFSRGNKGGQVTPVVVLTNSAHFPSLRLALPNCRRDLTRRERNA